jgi:hypothetical protein
LAFKFGRFIEVDDSTKQFSRCDVGRVKIVTTEKSLIDSTMAVKVLGRRFDIRVMEEVGSDPCVHEKLHRRGENWPEEVSSRASGEGASFQAVVEGISETGSEVDVSESAQVLLAIEAHALSNTATDRSMEGKGCVAGSEAEYTPIILGNPSSLVTHLVNLDGDKCTRDVVDIEETKFLLEGVNTRGDSGVHEGEDVLCVGSEEVGLEVERINEVGPIQGPFANYVGPVGSKESPVGVFGPRVLRTKKGDINIVGPSLIQNGEVQILDNHNFSAMPHVIGKRKQPMSVKHAMKGPRPDGGNIRKNQHRVLPDLPFHKLRKLYAPQRIRNRNVRRRKPDQSASGSSSTSDSIQNSTDLVPVASPMVQEVVHNDVAVDFTLEVVLPCFPPAETGSTRGANNEGSGMVVLIQSEDVGICQSPDHVLLPPPRQVMEATKIMELQSEVGIKIQGNSDEYLKRIMGMEERDRAEKEGWELNREIVGSQ